MALTYGSLFTGIGGFDLGFDLAGLVCRWQVEKDKYCRQVLERRWPDVEKFGDVKNVGRKNLRPVDVICGGFPCQDLSVAGRRQGLAGKRSGLWYEFHRIVGELKPGWVVVENVPGLLSSSEGRDFAVILRGLEEFGYTSAWRILDAQYFGVPQRRRRLFIVASLGNGRCANVLFESDGGAWHPAPGRKTGAEVAGTIAGSPRNGDQRKEADRNELWIGEGGGSPGRMEAGQVTHSVRPRSGMPRGWNSNLVSDIEMSLTSRNDRLDGETQTFIANTFNGYTGGADDNDAQGWHYVPALVKTLNSGGNDGGFRTEPGEHLIAATSQSGGNGGKPSSRGEHLVSDVAPTLGKESYSPTKTSTGQAIDFCDTKINGGVRRLTPIECARLQGFPDDWNEFLSDSQRYRQYGNAVAVPVAEWLARRILEAS